MVFMKIQRGREENSREDYLTITFSKNEEDILRALNVRKGQDRFMKNYFHFLTLVKSSDANCGLGEKVKNFQEAKRVYDRLHVDEVQHSNEGIIVRAMDGIRKDYEDFFNYLQNRGE